MKNIATTQEQSKRLIACGVSPGTADMYLEKCRLPEYGDFYLHTVLDNIDVSDWFSARINKDIIPAWSLSALLSLCPKEIYEDNNNAESYYFSLAKEFPLSEEYGAAYIPCWYNGNAIVRKRDNRPIEAVVQLIEWLTSNGYQLNKKKDNE